MHDQILKISTNTSMALGSGTVATEYLGIPIGELGSLIAGLSAFGAFLIALATFIRNKKK